MAVLSVQNVACLTLAGVPEHLREAIFARGVTSKPDVPGGRGIGLALVRLVTARELQPQLTRRTLLLDSGIKVTVSGGPSLHSHFYTPEDIRGRIE